MSPVYDSTRQRRLVLLAMMGITIAGGLFFVNFNLLRGAAGLAMMQGLFVLFSLCLLPAVWRTRRIRFWACIYLLPWVAMMLIVLALPESTGISFIWPALLPLVLHFLLGWRLGLLLSLLALAATAKVALWRFGLPADPEDVVLVGNFVIAALAVTIVGLVYDRGREMAEQELHRLAVTDSLTSLPNRMLLASTYHRLEQRAEERGEPLSLLLIDLDHFKTINDRHGHNSGDKALVHFARFLRGVTRSDDFACRLGGEEFLVLLPDSNTDQAVAVARKLRRHLNETPLEHQGQSITFTASIGVAERGRDGENLEDLMRTADRRLYRSKELGRNRVDAGQPDTN